MNLARAMHFDESDQQVFHKPAQKWEWAISGGFEFSNWGEADLEGKARQAFANGWLGLETFGRVSIVAVTHIEPDEFERLVDGLAQHFVDVYGAPTLADARPVAVDEMNHMADLCADQEPNTLLAIHRELTEAGVREAYRALESPEAGLEILAVHGDVDGMGFDPNE